ncbi:MAG: O-succinylhomoserine sulfhydrylase [Gammaproteobacteria bacterium]|nr:MAG: O-succinylhomoserine sulfhydrylase [Gammaproteobacteria bacterium]
MAEKKYHRDTLAVRAGYQRTPEGEQSEAIFPTISFVYDSAEQAAQRFSGESEGNIYSRFTNPTVRTFEQRLAAVEGAESCVATASGMSAVLATMMGVLSAGDHVLTSRSLFGSTIILFEKILARFGLQFDYVDMTDIEAWKKAVRPETRMLFVETPSNPLMELADIAALAQLAHANDALLAVDNTFLTPMMQRPLELGADISVYSATKYMDGQGRVLGGAVVGSNETVGEQVYSFLRSAGPCMSPFNAWVFLKGMETLGLRMQAHSDNALMLAQWLEARPEVSKVYYPGLASHPQHELAKNQQQGFGGVLAFAIKGDRAAAWRMIDGTELVSKTANLGDTKSIITHPASTTHGRLSQEERDAAGVHDNIIRLSVGLEHVDDLKADLETGLAAI